MKYEMTLVLMLVFQFILLSYIRETNRKWGLVGALKTIEIYISSFFALFFFSIEKNKKNRREEKTFILFGVMNDNL